MICSSANFDLFMVRSSHWAGLWHQMEELSGARAPHYVHGQADCLRNSITLIVC